MTERPENLRELLEARAAAAPAKTFLFSEQDGRKFTYAEFDAAVNATARMLAYWGVRKGDVVSLLLPNGAEYVVAYFACFKLGALAGPVNSLLKPEEMAYVLDNCGAKLMLCGSEFKPQSMEFLKTTAVLRDVYFFDDVAAMTNANLADVDELPDVPLNRDDEAIIIYTSGTTGKPKGCLLTHGNLLANARQIVDWLGFTEDDRLLTVMPLFHMNAVTVTTASALHAGGSTVVSPRFSASKFWQIVSDYGVTSFGSVATMLSMLLAKYPEGVPAGLDTSRLRFAMCGSAPVPAEVLRRFEEKFSCLVVEGYGLSESTCRSTFNPPDERRRPGSCGVAIGNEMKVVDEEDREVPTGDLGEIVMRGENVFKGYYKNEEATAHAIRGGENIYPREIDELLYKHESIAEAAVVGVPDELYGEEVAAFVVLKEGREADPSEIIEYCRAHLADFKCPKSVYFLDALPKGPTGKVLKRELVRSHREGHAV